MPIQARNIGFMESPRSQGTRETAKCCMHGLYFRTAWKAPAISGQPRMSQWTEAENACEYLKKQRFYNQPIRLCDFAFSFGANSISPSCCTIRVGQEVVGFIALKASTDQRNASLINFWSLKTMFTTHNEV